MTDSRDTLEALRADFSELANKVKRLETLSAEQSASAPASMKCGQHSKA
jgi:hypothetical protein